MQKLLTVVFLVVFAAGLGAQAPSTAQPPSTARPSSSGPQPTSTAPTQPAQPTGKPASPPAQSAGRISITVEVTDPAGTPLSDVKVVANGTTPREGVTNKDGTVRLANLRAGTYRLRFEAEDCVLFEREVTIRAGQPTQVEVTLTPAPPKRPEPPPQPAPTPVPPPPQAPSGPPGSVELLSVPDWIEKNYIGRNDPRKVSTLGTTPGAAATLLQLREPLAEQSNDAADVMLYVVSGDGAVRIDGVDHVVGAGWFVVIPRGTAYGITRRGRNPLFVLSILAPNRP